MRPSWALNLAPVPAGRGGQPSTACTFVLVGLASHAGPDNTGALPSVATLVRCTGLSERTVRTCLDRLQAGGIIWPCDPGIVAARIKRADRRPRGWDLNFSLVRHDLDGGPWPRWWWRSPGPGLATAYTSSGLSACCANCATIASSFLTGLNRLDLSLYFGSIALMYLAPALMGLFWGAPLIAHELEAGMHRIAWTQSVTRTRWTLVKLGLVSLAAIAAAGLLSLMVTWWASPIDHAASLTGGPVQAAAVATGRQGLNATWFVPSWIAPPVFAARGVAPLGYAAFAFALGVTAGVLLRRTLPAMAVTLTVFVVIQVLVPNLLTCSRPPTSRRR